MSVLYHAKVCDFTTKRPPRPGGISALIHSPTSLSSVGLGDYTLDYIVPNRYNKAKLSPAISTTVSYVEMSFVFLITTTTE
jgi:hypothetical protein